MRFDLKVPFAEKDEAKRLGARWDAARKLWYAQDKDIEAFARWSPTPHDGASSPAAAGRAPRRTAVNIEQSGKIHVGSQYVEQTRVCSCLPWEVCELCQASALS